MRIQELSFSYGKNRSILNRVAFDIEEGEYIAVLGNNGAGKSTLIKCLIRILKPQEGIIEVDGKDMRPLRQIEIAKKMAYVSQKNEIGKLTVFDSVLLGRKPHIAFNPGKEDLFITKSVIERMALEHLSLRYTDELSGGEFQKVMLARALAQQPRVLLLDEPTSSLDLKNQYEVLQTIRQIADEKRIRVIMVIHDLNLALRYCDRFLFIKDREIYNYGGMEIITEETLSSVYGLPIAVETVNGVPLVIPIPNKEFILIK